MNQRVLAAVDVELTAAAAERWATPAEGFLWRARRCAEAMLYALLVEAKVDVTQLAEQGKGLDNLAKHTKLQGAIPRELRNHLESVQKYGNTAAHFQADGPASDASAVIVASALSDLARWFLTRDGKAVPDALAAPLAALTDERQRLRSPAELALQQEQQRAHDLRRRLDAATVPGAEQPPAPFTARLAAAGVALALIGGALGFGAGRSTAPAVASTAVALPAPIPTPVTVAAQPDPIAPEPVPAIIAEQPTVDAAAPAPGVRSCPPTMALVGRANEPGAFCVDRGPVTQRTYQRCVDDHACEPPPPPPDDGCNGPHGRYDLPANCLPWRLAEQYCRQRNRSSELPGRADWQIIGASRVRVSVFDATAEWLSDTPTGLARQVRGARNPPGFAWSTRLERRGYRDVSFRCVLRAVPP